MRSTSRNLSGWHRCLCARLSTSRFTGRRLGARGLFDIDNISRVARSVGLDTERIARDLEDPSLEAPIERNAILAHALGVRGTSAFVIGDGMIRGADC